MGPVQALYTVGYDQPDGYEKGDSGEWPYQLWPYLSGKTVFHK